MHVLLIQCEFKNTQEAPQANKEVHVEPGDEHFVDLPRAGADTKVTNLRVRVERGYTALPRSTALIVGKPKSGNPDEVGVYIRKNTNVT